MTLEPRRQGRARGVRLVAAALALVAGALAGCGADLHPGTAAVVNGTSISQTEVDELVTAACEYTELSREQSGNAGGSPSLARSGLRATLVDALIRFELTRAKADELGVSVSDAQVAKLASGNPMPEGIDESDEKLLSEFFRDAARAQLLQGVIGAHLKDPSVTDAADVTQEDVDAAADYLDSYAKKADVELNPRYGTWTGSAVKQASGSLSHPVDTTAAPVGLPGQPVDTVSALPESHKCG